MYRFSGDKRDSINKFISGEKGGDGDDLLAVTRGFRKELATGADRVEDGESFVLYLFIG